MRSNWFTTDVLVEWYKRNLKSSNPEMLAKFVKINGFNRVALPRDCARLKRVFETGRISVDYRDLRPDRPPYQDHASLFKNTRTGLMCMVFHPYQEPMRIRAELEAWAGVRGLRSAVHEKECSWYYPGHTALVLLFLPGDEIRLPERREVGC